MITEYFSNVRQNFKKICDIVVEQDEEVIVTRQNHQDVIIISLEKYSKLMKLQEKELEQR